MTARQFANLVRARRCGSGWKGKCPAHPDREPSLSIQQRKDGSVGLHCFTGCDAKAILDALGLSFSDLHLDADNEAWIAKKRAAEQKCPSIKNAAERKPLGRQEASYRYTNEFGEFVAEKLRFEGKIFLWRKPNGPGWIWKVDRSKLPLYRLHEVAKAKVVYLVEGEKDADNLAKCLPRDSGVAVTTAPNGAKSWRLEYVKWFAGKKVWILPDSDEPGIAYANLAAKQISKVAQTVRVVSLSPSKDVSEFLSNRSPSELSNIMKMAVKWRSQGLPPRINPTR